MGSGKLEIFKVYVKEKNVEEEQLLYTQSIVHEELDFINHEPLVYQESFYIMNEYTRQEGILRIGVQEPFAEKVIVMMDDIAIQLTRSKIDTSFWYEPARSWKDGWFKTNQESCFGMNASGRATIKTYDEYNQVMDTKTVLVIPSTFTYKQYEMMKMEVKTHLEYFAASSLAYTKTDKVKGIQIPLFQLTRLEELLEKLNQHIQLICKTPAERLTQERKKVMRSQVEKWDGRSIVESMVRPSSQKIQIRVMKKDNDLPEHQMIKGFLLLIRSRIIQEKTVEQSFCEQLRNERNVREKNLREVSSRDRGLIAPIWRREQSMKESIDLLYRRGDRWNICLDIIDRLLVDPLFDVGKADFHYTHLFGYDSIYKEIYHLFHELEKLLPELKSIEWNFIDAVISSPQLYQLWVLLQIISELERFQFQTEKVWSSLMNHYKKKEDLIGWKCTFSSKKRGKIALYYEYEVKSQEGKMMQPDYMIAYKGDENEQWDLHILDAKYKPYSAMKHGQRTLKKDIERSANRYIRNMETSKTRVRSATLIHTDSNIVHWNLEDGSLYELSHFYLLPGNMENLNTYMKRFFHFFNDQTDICLTCGGNTIPLLFNNKETYICENDDEVWVKNSCRYSRSHKNHPRLSLMKYASQNYNRQVQADWNVHCPVCKKEYAGQTIHLDCFGHPIPLSPNS